MKTNIKIIVALIIGVILSTFFSCCFAETLINSKDVVYEDNSNLAAENVQDAIDGTCSKVDTRLSDIEDKLYLFKDFNVTKEITTTTSLSYTGISVELPANSYCTLLGVAPWSHGKPLEVRLTYSSTDVYKSYPFSTYTSDTSTWYLYTNYSLYIDTKTAVYLWTKYSEEAVNSPSIRGWCATKYK